MSNYSLHLENVPGKTVLAILELLPKQTTISVSNRGTAQPAPPQVSRVMPTTPLMLGNIEAAPQTGLTGQIIKIIQTHEKKHGAGSMTRSELTDELSEYSDAPAAAIGAAINKGYIRGIAN